MSHLVLEYINPATNRRPRLSIFWCVCAFSIASLLAFRWWLQQPPEHFPDPPRESLASTDLTNMQSALYVFEVDNGRFPTTAEGLQALLTAPPGENNWHGPYLQHAPRDPWANPYSYRCTQSLGFELRCAGPDGIFATSDDIVVPDGGAYELQAAIRQFQSDTGHVPTAAQGIRAMMRCPAKTRNWRGPYLITEPKDPWGNPFLYFCRSGNSFQLRSAGPDGKPGTADDIVVQ